jgi:hypothetical protein
MEIVKTEQLETDMWYGNHAHDPRGLGHRY